MFLAGLQGWSHEQWRLTLLAPQPLDCDTFSNTDNAKTLPANTIASKTNDGLDQEIGSTTGHDHIPLGICV